MDTSLQKASLAKLNLVVRKKPKNWNHKKQKETGIPDYVLFSFLIWWRKVKIKVEAQRMEVWHQS